MCVCVCVFLYVCVCGRRKFGHNLTVCKLKENKQYPIKKYTSALIIPLIQAMYMRVYMHVSLYVWVRVHACLYALSVWLKLKSRHTRKKRGNCSKIIISKKKSEMK